MWIAPAAAPSIAIALALPARRFWPALPWLLLWLFSPLLAWWLSRRAGAPRSALIAAQSPFLRNVARRTWEFFERFVGEDDHWLPPDNYQEHPIAKIAHRTSPTNIGLSLLATSPRTISATCRCAT